MGGCGLRRWIVVKGTFSTNSTLLQRETQDGHLCALIPENWSDTQVVLILLLGTLYHRYLAQDCSTILCIVTHITGCCVMHVMYKRKSTAAKRVKGQIEIDTSSG